MIPIWAITVISYASVGCGVFVFAIVGEELERIRDGKPEDSREMAFSLILGFPMMLVLWPIAMFPVFDMLIQASKSETTDARSTR